MMTNSVTVAVEPMSATWTTERTETLRRMIAVGRSAASIAKALAGLIGTPVTRNAVIGKAGRLGLKFSGNRSVEGERAPKAPKVAKAKPAPDVTALFWQPKAKPAPKPQPEAAPEPAEPPRDHFGCHGGQVTFDELAGHHCRWPGTREGETVYCGATRLEPLFYCSHHCRVAYRPQQRRDR